MGGEIFAIIAVVIFLALFIGIVVWILIAANQLNVGAPCISNSDCRGNLVCDPTLKVCRQPLGGACGDNSDCVTPLRCSLARCVAVLEDIVPSNVLITPPIVTLLPPPIVEPPVEPPTERPLLPQVKPPPLPPTEESPLPPTERLSPPVEVVPSSIVIQPFPRAQPISINIGSGSTDGGRSSGTGISRDLSLGSDSSTRSSDLSTPYNKDDDKIYFKPVPSHNKGIIDVASFSNAIIFLTQSGKIIKEAKGKRSLIKSNILIKRLEKHMGYLYALSSGTIHRLDNGSYDSNIWSWKRCEWSPVDIVHTSATLDGDYIWLQTETKGTLYDSKLSVVQTVPMIGITRRYGPSVSQYVDTNIVDGKATVVNGSDSRTINDVHVATITHHAEVIIINKTDATKYSDIRIVKWKPYFIST